MNERVLILRPQPGAAETAARAQQMGLSPETASIFTIRPLDWDAPPVAEMDSVLLTSAQGASQGGAKIALFTHLPCYAVGPATAAAASAAGFANVRAGTSDGAAALAALAADGLARPFHPCGREHIASDALGVTITRRTVYAADPVEALPSEAATALASGALVLLHSPRAAAVFGALVMQAGLDRGNIALAAISKAAATAAGPAWESVGTASEPRDEALLELAAKLCKTMPSDKANGR